MTPYQAMIGREPSILNVGEFGCDVYVHQHRSQRDMTFSPKAEPGIYLGHSSRQNCAVVLLIRSSKLVLSKDVQFREGSFIHRRALCAGNGRDIEPIAAGTLDETDEPQPAAEHEPRPEVEETVEDARYKLKAITDAREQGGAKQYCCKWVGYSAATWEPADVIAQDAPDMVREYESLVQGRTAAVAQSRATTRSQSSKSVSFSDAASSSSSSSSPSSSSPRAEDDDSDSESDSKLAATFAARRL